MSAEKLAAVLSQVTLWSGRDALKLSREKKTFHPFILEESVTKHFCRHCGTPLFNSNKRYPGHRMVAVGSLDDPTVVTPTANIHCDSQLSWVTLDEQLQKFPQDYS